MIPVVLWPKCWSLLYARQWWMVVRAGTRKCSWQLRGTHGNLSARQYCKGKYYIFLVSSIGFLNSSHRIFFLGPVNLEHSLCNIRSRFLDFKFKNWKIFSGKWPLTLHPAGCWVSLYPRYPFVVRLILLSCTAKGSNQIHLTYPSVCFFNLALQDGARIGKTGRPSRYTSTLLRGQRGV